MIVAARRAAAAAAILAGLALAASIYGPLRLAVAMQVLAIISIAGSILLLADRKDRRP